MYGIWCKDRPDGGDWLRSESHHEGIIAFASKRAAQKAAAVEYGYPSYTAAKRNDWCEVRWLDEGRV